jgi:hypothetical protein
MATNTLQTRLDIWIPAATGLLGLILLLLIAERNPTPTAFQLRIYLTVLALAAASFAALIPGLLNVNLSWTGLTIRAAGALAVFILVFFYEPAQERLAQVLGAPTLASLKQPAIPAAGTPPAPAGAPPVTPTTAPPRASEPKPTDAGTSETKVSPVRFEDHVEVYIGPTAQAWSKNFSAPVTVCTPEKPESWTIKSVRLHLESDTGRSTCGAWTTCSDASADTKTRACRSITVQGYERNEYGGYGRATPVLTVTWSKPIS